MPPLIQSVDKAACAADGPVMSIAAIVASRPLRSRFDGWLDGEGPD